MTEEELQSKCRSIMQTHLESKGWPDMSDAEIFNELQVMWLLLEENGLMPELKSRGYDFHRFVDTAQRMAMHNQLRAELEQLMGFRR